MIAGQWLAGVFADVLGWRAGFIAVAVLFASAGVAMRWGARDAKPTGAPATASGTATGPAQVSSLQRTREVLRSRQARLVLAVTAIEGGFAYSAMAFAPSHLHGRFGMAVSTAGAILALYGVGGVATEPERDLAAGAPEAAIMARAGGLLSGLAWVLFALAPGPAWTLPLCLLAGLGFYMIHNTLQMQATQMAPTQRGTAAALFACAIVPGPGRRDGDGVLADRPVVHDRRAGRLRHRPRAHRARRRQDATVCGDTGSGAVMRTTTDRHEECRRARSNAGRSRAGRRTTSSEKDRTGRQRREPAIGGRDSTAPNGQVRHRPGAYAQGWSGP